MKATKTTPSHDPWLAGLVKHQKGREAKHRPRLFGAQGGLSSLILGCLALGIALVVCGTWFAARICFVDPIWCETETVQRGSDFKVVTTQGPGGEVTEQTYQTGDGIPVIIVTPTVYSTLLGILGSLIALAGLIIAWLRRNSLPLICAIAISLCWIPLLASFLEALFVGLS